jgi:lysophospholipase L1-like esterase
MVNWPDIVEKDPWLFWQLKANTSAPEDRGKMTGFIANSDHMRNPEVPVERGPSDFRVLALGDSNTFGWGVDYEEAYPTLLAGLLRGVLPAWDVHVLNGGCSGYSAYQGLEILRRRGVKYRPDVVTIWFGWNDKATWDGMTDAEHARLFAREHWLTRSATYRALSYMLRRASHDAVREQRDEAEARQRRMPLDDYKARLRDMVELARATEVEPGTGRGAQPVLIQGCKVKNLRWAIERGGEAGVNRWLKAAEEVGEELDVPVLPVCDVLYRGGLGPDVFIDDGHLRPPGLRLVAEALLDLFAENGMLPEPVVLPAARGAGR